MRSRALDVSSGLISSQNSGQESNKNTNKKNLVKIQSRAFGLES